MKKQEFKYKIAELIYKSISKTISKEEQLILDKWLNDESNLELYNRIISAEQIKGELAIYSEINIDKAYNIFEKKLSESEKQVRRLKFFKVLKYASIIIVLLGIGYVYQSGVFKNNPQLVVPNESITLQLENGDIKILNEDGSITVTNSQGKPVGTQKGAKIIYTNETQEEKLVYNTLTVPYGKRFEVQLSDGTVVNLNAGTSLTYPVKFIAGKNRNVMLKGEAFFNVTKDAKHPFIVNSEALNVQVLGTQFNMSSYPEDTQTDVVLVEGSVNLSATNDKNNSALLSPGFKGSINKTTHGEISTKPVITSIYTAWIDGELVFRNITFSNILKRMERHYNIKIVNRNTTLSNEKFNASFRDEPIDKILEYFKITYNIDYQIKDNKILIN